MLKDHAWKNVIESMFEEFCYFFLPDLAKDLDFNKGYEFLDKELEQISLESVENHRYLDKLTKVFLNNGEEQWILIHTEVQGYQDKAFSERMFVYFYRIYDKFKKKVLSFAILADSGKNYRPECFTYEFYGVKQEYRFRIYKIFDQDEKAVEQSGNPFATVVLAAKYSLHSAIGDDEKLAFKLKLIRLLLDKGFKKEVIRNLFKFIDVMIKITDEMKTELFYKELKNLSGGKIMETMGDFEEFVFKKGIKKGIEEGIEKGKLEGKLDDVKRLLLKGLSQQEVSELLEMDMELISKVAKEI